jgi:hypothetical protein
MRVIFRKVQDLFGEVSSRASKEKAADLGRFNAMALKTPGQGLSESFVGLCLRRPRQTPP